MALSLKNVKDGEISLCAKFRFNVIIVARNIANKHFSLKKAPDLGLKHLEPNFFDHFPLLPYIFPFSLNLIYIIRAFTAIYCVILPLVPWGVSPGGEAFDQPSLN